MHVLTQREIRLPAPPGYAAALEVATRWDRDDSGGWHLAVVDTGGDAYGSCFTSARLEKGAPRGGTVSAGALLGDMGICCHKTSNLPEAKVADEDFGLWWIRVPTELDSSIVLEMLEGEGDVLVAKEPVYWVNRRSGERRVIYGRGQSRYDALGQVAFGEREGYLLIVSEFSGAFPAVANLRTGEELLRVERESARAVWVPAPR